MHKRTPSFAFIALLLTSFVALTVQAMSVALMTPAQLEARADLIVDAEAISQRTAMVGTRVITFVTLRPLHIYKGTASANIESQIVVAELGGRINNKFAQHVPGQPMLAIGHRYRLHLGAPNGPDGARGIVGFQQGVAEIDATGAVVQQATASAPKIHFPSSVAP